MKAGVVGMVAINRYALFGRCRISILVMLSLMIATMAAVTRYEREIDDFNAKARTFLVSGEFRLRQFDENGIPISYTARKPNGFQSPYYVVHYGLIYSEAADSMSTSVDALWFHDPSIASWDIPPPQMHINRENFLTAADWVVNNLSNYQGHAHLLYDFDWSYPGLQGGELSAPWWSGLTDGYAILLLLRAYDVTAEEKYAEAAAKLYESVLAKVEDGGSLLTLSNDTLWIEEYVVSGLPAELQPRVLNGMIYSYLGVRAFEAQFPASSRQFAPRLLDSIRLNLDEFDMGWWVAYDLLGNPTNLKYFEITLGQLKLLARISGQDAFLEVYDEWRDYRSWWMPLAVKWLLNGHFSYAALNIVLEIVFVWLVCALFLWKLARRR